MKFDFFIGIDRQFSMDLICICAHLQWGGTDSFCSGLFFQGYFSHELSSTHLWSINLWQRKQEYTVEKRQSLQPVVLGKLDQFSSVQFSCSVVSDSLRLHESQHARPPCPSQTPGVYSNTCPSSRWCHPAISSSVVPFSSCPLSLPASGSFLRMGQLFAWGGQSIGVSASASVLPMKAG